MCVRYATPPLARRVSHILPPAKGAIFALKISYILRLIHLRAIEHLWAQAKGRFHFNVVPFSFISQHCQCDSGPWQVAGNCAGYRNAQRLAMSIASSINQGSKPIIRLIERSVISIVTPIFL